MADRKPLAIDGTFITVPVSPIAAAMITAWVRENLDGLRDRLAVHGLNPDEIVAPTWKRIVYTDEVTGTGDPS